MPDISFLTTLTTAFVILIASFIVPIVVVLIWPGRKGKLRTTREVAITGMSLEQVWSLLTERMMHEQFIVDQTGYPTAIKARRAARHTDTAGNTIVTHATMPLALEGELFRSGSDVVVRLTLWMDDFVLLDSGEGRQIDLMLERLLHAELDQEPPPVVRSVSLIAFVGIAAAALTLAGLAVPWHWQMLWEQSRLFGYASGLFVGSLYACGMARETLRAIRARPAELTGAWLAYLTLALGFLAMFGSAGLIVAHYIGVLPIPPK